MTFKKRNCISVNCDCTNFSTADAVTVVDLMSPSSNSYSERQIPPEVEKFFSLSLSLIQKNPLLLILVGITVAHLCYPKWQQIVHCFFSKFWDSFHLTRATRCNSTYSQDVPPSIAQPMRHLVHVQNGNIRCKRLYRQDGAPPGSLKMFACHLN